MTRVLIAMALISLGGFLISSAQQKKRAVLVFGSPAEIQAQLNDWKPASDDFAEHNISVLTAPDLKNCADLAEQLSIAPGDFAVVVVGKDGHSACRFPRQVPAERILETVDAAAPAENAPLKAL